MIVNPAYELRNVKHYYNGSKALEIDELQIQKGSITGLMGPNGSGKSTLLNLLAFAHKPSEGNIFFNGKITNPFSKQARSKVTLLTQEPYLLKRTVFENIIYGLKIRKDYNNINSRVESALEAVGLDFNQFSQRKWHELSGGEAQRVAMASRLILNPEVLLLDEPTASVDIESAKLIRNASIKARKNFGTTLVVASHDWHWLYEISDSQLHLFDGKIFSAGMENIIAGPWDKIDSRKVIKPLENNQKIQATAPLDDDMVAIIKKENLKIDFPKDINHKFDNNLEGHVTRMILERKSMAVITTITIEDLLFTIRLEKEKLNELNLYPGKKIILRFNKEDIEWI